MFKNKLWLSLFVVFVLVMVGCTNQFDNTADSSGDGDADVQEEGNQQLQEAEFEWVAQSPWPSGTALQKMAEKTADNITKASNGRLTVKMHAAGEIVDAFELLDAVDQGTLDAMHSWDGYWVGKMPQLALFASVPMGMDEQEYLGWITMDEGLELWQEIYDESGYNVKVMDAGAGTPEIFYHSNKPIRTLEDLDGMKVRAVGEWAAILERVGASVVNLDGGELYQGLERGVVDAIEFSSPASNYPLGFHEIAKYVVTPAIHQPGNAVNFGINKDKWDELPDDLKEIVKLSTQTMWGVGWAELAKEDLEYMEKYRELEEEGVIEIIEFEKESQKELKVIIDEYYEELSEKDPLFKKVWDSQQAFLEDFQYWQELMRVEY